jgi:signal peptidase I
MQKRWEKEMEGIKSKLLSARGEFFRFWLPVIATIMFVRGTIAEARFIPSSSMEPTLQIQDRILVEKVSNRFLGRPIKHGDILVFYPPAIETGITGSPRVISSFLPATISSCAPAMAYSSTASGCLRQATFPNLIMT